MWLVTGHNGKHEKGVWIDKMDLPRSSGRQLSIGNDF